MCSAIILAGGNSSRFGGNVPKQFSQLGGKPVLAHSLLALGRNELVERLILVAPQEYVEFCRELATKLGVSCEIIVGGKTRQESVYAALLQLAPAEGLVLVHDGARPFVQAMDVAEVLAAAKEHNAATVGFPATDTLKFAEGGQILETLPREKIFAVQTPQAFRISVLLKAHEAAREAGFVGNDDCELVEKLGIRPAIVAGCPGNIKITYEIDLILAKGILENLREGTK